METSDAPPQGLLARMRASQGVRAGAFLSVATLVLNGASYVYYVACIRYLGSRVYGDVAAMVALFSLVSLPLVSIQSLLAREAAQLPSQNSVGVLLRRATWLAAIVGMGVVGP